MKITLKRSALLLALLSVAGIGVGGGLLWSGSYNVAADDAHTAPVLSMLTTMREQSIRRHAAEIKVPDLSAPEKIRQGAGNYAAMCTACHLAPGMAPTELSKGLYPVPPSFKSLRPNPAHQFWVIKHGIKASGMPAWGRSMDDEYIWGMVAFLQRLPSLSEAEYVALVESSEGHSHGGDETHSHQSDTTSKSDHATGATAANTHVHGDGKTHVHDAPAKGATATRKPDRPSENTATPKKQAPAEAPAPLNQQPQGDHHEGH